MSGSIEKSSFNFINYKVNSFEFDSKKSLDLLSRNSPLPHWEYNIGVAQPLYSISQKIYFCTLALEGKGFGDKSQASDPDSVLIKFKTEATGLFSVQDRVDKTLEEGFVKIQAPALLMSFLRSTTSSYFANAGFGSLIMPLINMQKFAVENLSNLDVETIK